MLQRTTCTYFSRQARVWLGDKKHHLGHHKTPTHVLCSFVRVSSTLFYGSGSAFWYCTGFVEGRGCWVQGHIWCPPILAAIAGTGSSTWCSPVPHTSGRRVFPNWMSMCNVLFISGLARISFSISSCKDPSSIFLVRPRSKFAAQTRPQPVLVDM